MEVQEFKKSKATINNYLCRADRNYDFICNADKFQFMHGIQTLPKAFSWMVSNLYITEQSLRENALRYG